MRFVVSSHELLVAQRLTLPAGIVNRRGFVDVPFPAGRNSECVAWVLTHVIIGILEFEGRGRSWKTVLLDGTYHGRRSMHRFISSLKNLIRGTTSSRSRRRRDELVSPIAADVQVLETRQLLAGAAAATAAQSTSSPQQGNVSQAVGGKTSEIATNVPSFAVGQLAGTSFSVFALNAQGQLQANDGKGWTRLDSGVNSTVYGNYKTSQVLFELSSNGTLKAYTVAR
jgi:hypothetical protein